VADTWQQGDAYEDYVGRWSRRVAPRFLDWLDVPRERRWLDVGCGTGALAAAVLDRCAPATVDAVEPSDGFRAAAAARLGPRVRVHAGRAEAVPLPDAAVDATVSALVLNFVPDAPAALREMARVTAPGGTVAAYVWDYAEGMQLMRWFWDAARALDPAAAALDEGTRFPLCRPEPLARAFAGAGLGDVAVTALEVPTVFADFDDYWRPFEGGQGPAPGYAMALDPSARERLREWLRARLPAAAGGTITLSARAWAVRGVVAG
jgi:SAM-dependent methyltransferase